MPRFKGATFCPKCKHTNVKATDGACGLEYCLCRCIREEERFKMEIVSLTLPLGFDKMMKACHLVAGLNVDPITPADRHQFVAGLIWQFMNHYDPKVAEEFKKLNDKTVAGS